MSVIRMALEDLAIDGRVVAVHVRTGCHLPSANRPLTSARSMLRAFDIVEESRDRDAGTKVAVPSGAEASCPRHGYAWCSLCRGDTEEADASAHGSVPKGDVGAWVTDEEAGCAFCLPPSDLCHLRAFMEGYRPSGYMSPDARSGPGVGECDKGIWWMPWHREAMKDVARCEKLGGGASTL